MPRKVSQGELAAAISNLNCIGDLAKESFNGASACYKFHANSANNNMATIHRAGKRQPEWVYKNAAHLRVCGWTVPQ
jgi:hypothetical protein